MNPLRNFFSLWKFSSNYDVSPGGVKGRTIESVRSSLETPDNTRTCRHSRDSLFTLVCTRVGESL